jgi:Fe-S-cluster containining protein
MDELDLEQQEIDALKAADNFSGLGKKIQELFKLPQSLCKTRGNCCRVATFKGTLNYQDIVALANSDESDATNAQEFLTLFVPYETVEEVIAIAPQFVDRVQEKNPDSSFFHCRFLADDGRCLIHEDRPTGCRVYPFPHENTIYHPGCGFEKKGVENWRKIQDIQNYFEYRFQQLQEEISDIEEHVQQVLGESDDGEGDSTLPQ